MNSFSQRKGLKPIKSIVQVDSMDQPLRNGLWNALQIFYWAKGEGIYYVHEDSSLEFLMHLLWQDFFKQPVDEIGKFWLDTHQTLRAWFFESAWNEVYDFIEFVINNSPSGFGTERFAEFCNEILEREMSAYRLVDGVFAQLTSEEEIAEIEQAISTPGPLKPVSTHLKTALELLSDKTKPDYRNSIKESISAVESICNLITGGRDTLGEALKKVEATVAIHPALKKGFGNIYGYTNDASGIRHALLDEPDLNFEDAKFMLASCSTFINYLVYKASKAGIRFDN